jgi:RNA polymerase sigma factor (sigma-70 family)
MSQPGRDLLEYWCTHRDAETFRTIVNRHGPMVYATCTRILRDCVQAEDITQECFEALASARRPPREHLGGWLHGVATNLSLKYLRSTGRRKARERQYAEIHGATTEPAWDDIYPHVDEAIARLPEKLRVPMVAHFLDGMTQQAIAGRLGTSPSNVRYRIKQGLARIQTHLRKQHIVTGTGALSALFASRLAEGTELPTALSENLGRLALAQAGGATGAVTGGIWANAILWKSVLVAMIPVAAMVSAFVFLEPIEAPPMPGQEAMGALLSPVSTESSEPPRADRGETNSTTEPAPPNALAPLSAGVPEEFQYLFQPLEQGPGVVAGTIVDTDGTPAAGARVTLFSMDSWWQHGYTETFTNAQGRYEFRNLPMSHSYLLTAVSDEGFTTGYLALYTYSFLEERLAQLGAALSKDDMSRSGRGERIRRDLHLESFATSPITGRVLDAQRVPVEGAIVSTAGRPGLPQGLSMNVRTDREGRFAIHHVVEPEATCSLVAYAKGFAPTMIHDVKSMSSENEIYLMSGVRLSGMAVRVDTGEPAANLDVTLRTVSDHDPAIIATTNEMGEFLFEGLAPKVFTLSLVDLDKGLASTEAPKLDLRNGTSVDGLLLPVSAGATISGRVYVEETNEPIGGIHIGIRHTRTSVPIREAVTGPDGVYTLRCLPAGKYAVQCSPPENVVSHFHYSDQGPPGPVQEVEVAPEEQRDSVDFAFQGGVTVSGRVTDAEGNPIANANVRAKNSQRMTDSEPQPWQGLPLQTSVVATDAMGAYLLRGLAPSSEWTYTISVSARGFAGHESDPFQVTASMENKDFTLKPAAAFSGRVVSLKGEPLPMVSVGVVPETRGKGLSRTGAISDDGGYFEFSEGVLPGEYHFEASGFFNPNLDLPYNARTMNAPIVIEGTESVQGLRIVVPLAHECGTLSGQVFASDTKLLVEDAMVEVAWVVSDKGEDYGPSGRFERKAGPGSFRLIGVYPGTVTIRAWAGGYPKQEVHTVPVKSGEEITDLRLLLRHEAEVTASIQGTIYVNGSGTSTTQRMIHRRSPDETDKYDQIGPNDDGTYHFEKLEPKIHIISVVSREWTPDQQFVWMRQETVIIDAKPGYAYTQDFELGGTCTLRGRIALPPRARDARVTVGIPDPGGDTSTWPHWPVEHPQEVIAAATRVTESGEYLIRGIPPGAYTVTASCVVNQGTKAEQTLLVSEPVILGNGHEAVLDFAL